MKPVKHIFFASVVALILSTLCSCDPGVTYKKVIENNTGHSIRIFVYPDTSAYYQEAIYTDDTILITPHSETVIATYSGLGQTAEFKECNTYADSIVSEVIDDSTLHLVVNLAETGNWTFRRIKTYFKDGGECECRLVIDSSHIQ